jgi:hypothetical protein
VRRVRQYYYTRDFADLFVSEILLAGARMSQAIERLSFRMTSCGSELVDLLPLRDESAWPLAEDYILEMEIWFVSCSYFSSYAVLFGHIIF